MKMKIKDKLCLFFGGLVLAVASLWIIAMGLSIIGFPLKILPVEGIFGDMNARHITGVVGGLCGLAYGIYLMTIPARVRYSKKGYVIQKTEVGELRIKIEAIENLVQKCVDTHEEIEMEKMRVHSTGGNVKIDLDIALAGNVSIPMAVASLQKQIKQYLLASSGIDVEDISVTVQTADRQEASHDSPYSVYKDSPDTASAEEENKAKAPIHQRLFSEEEQKQDAPAAVSEETAKENEEPETAEQISDAPASEDAVQPEEVKENE